MNADPRIRDILRLLLKIEIAADGDLARRATPAWDSLKHMEILFAVEDSFGVEFSEDELAALDSLAKIVAAVEARGAA